LTAALYPDVSSPAPPPEPFLIEFKTLDWLALFVFVLLLLFIQDMIPY
jgi:hypothetical protein